MIRGRFKLLQYMPDKPVKYDIKIRSESGGNIVRFKKTRCNIITDNFFCSVSLAHCLLETLLWRLYNRTRQTSLL